jgi:hypothetical protein
MKLGEVGASDPCRGVNTKQYRLPGRYEEIMATIKKLKKVKIIHSVPNPQFKVASNKARQLMGNN